MLFNEIKITIKAKDIVGTSYISNTDCPLARKLKEQFPNSIIII